MVLSQTKVGMRLPTPDAILRVGTKVPTHRISDKAEAAYRRGDKFEKRRKLMEAWAEYYSRNAATVLAFKLT
jgi:hypothetical protein